MKILDMLQACDGLMGHNQHLSFGLIELRERRKLGMIHSVCINNGEKNE